MMQEIKQSIKDDYEYANNKGLRARTCLEKQLNDLFVSNYNEYLECKYAVNPNPDDPNEQSGPWNEFDPFNLLVYSDSDQSDGIIMNWLKKHGIPFNVINASTLGTDTFVLHRTFTEAGNQEYITSAQNILKGISASKEFSVLLINNIDKLPVECEPGVCGLLQDRSIPYMNQTNDGYLKLPNLLFTIATCGTQGKLSKKLANNFKHYPYDTEEQVF